MELSNRDRVILRELIKDGRAKVSTIAKGSRLSRDIVENFEQFGF
ncbi:MAG: hypothetical protein AABX47_08385 [Nanoarchaeota archaeon]